MQGELDRGLNREIFYGLVGIPFAMLGIVAFALASFLGAPLAITIGTNAFFTAGLIYLTGLAYGMVSDVLGARQDLAFYILGHEPYQKSLVRSNDAFIQGIAWGVYHAYPPAGIAAAMGGIVAAIATIAGAPIVGFAVPVASLTLPFLLFSASYVSNKQAKRRIQKNHKGQFSDKDQYGYTLDDYLKSLRNPARRSQFATYQRNGLLTFSNSHVGINNWMRSNERNNWLIDFMPLTLFSSFIVFILLTAVGSFLPEFMLASGIAVYLPIVFSSVLAVAVLGLGAYMYVCQDKQVDNHFKIEWPELERISTVPSHQIATSAKMKTLVSTADTTEANKIVQTGVKHTSTHNRHHSYASVNASSHHALQDDDKLQSNDRLVI